MSEIDRFSSAATRLLSSVIRYAEEAAVKIGGKDRSEVEATLRQAKAIGELTVLMSSAKVKEMLANLTPETATAPSEDFATETQPSELTETMEAPLPDYDALTAAQIVTLMANLSPEERAVVIAYEEQHRRRSTILNGHSL